MVDEGITAVPPAQPTRAQLDTAAAIDAACRKHGFVQVINFGLTPELRLATFEASTKLFAMPDEHKRSNYKPITPETNTGYAPYGKESLNRARPSDLKEAYNVRHPKLGTNSFTGVPDGFEETVLTFRACLERAQLRYSMACALALELEIDFFVSALRNYDQCTMRLLHYAPCDSPTPKDGALEATPIRIGEHTDYGTFTFLLFDPRRDQTLEEGLQMRPCASADFNDATTNTASVKIKPITGSEVGGAMRGEGDGWLDVVPEPQPPGVVTAIVNTGACVARWTNDEWKATAHRVVVPNAAVAAADRYSIASFTMPDREAEVAVHPRFVRPGEELKYPPTTGRDYLLFKLREAQEGWKEGRA